MKLNKNTLRRLIMEALNEQSADQEKEDLIKQIFESDQAKKAGYDSLAFAKFINRYSDENQLKFYGVTKEELATEGPKRNKAIRKIGKKERGIRNTLPGIRQLVSLLSKG